MAVPVPAFLNLWTVPRGKDLELAATRSAAKALGVTLQPVAVRGPGDFDEAFAAISRPDALIAFSEPLVLMLLRAYRTIDFCDTFLALRLPMHLAKILGGLRRGRGHRTNLCTTKTRPRRDLSVTWPSQGTFPRSHPSARGPALTTLWPG